MKKIIFSILTIIIFFSERSYAQDFIRLTESIVSKDSGASRSVNWIDYDNDNDLDLFISSGYRYGENNLLYRNDNGAFVKVFDQPVVRDSLPSDGSSWGDYNNDGFPDLCVVNWWNKITLLYSNDGGGNFTFQSSSPVCNRPSYSETCSWGDYDNDGLIDLFITNSSGTGHRNFLYKNTGGGNFVKIDTGIAVSEIGNARGMNWVDIDNDGMLDIFICREEGRTPYLYKNNGKGFFTKVTNTPLTNNAGDCWSSSWGDFDNDGDLDVLVTNRGSQGNFLYRNDGNFTFTQITNGPLVNDPSGYSACSGWGDFDNDGDLDMFITQAYVPPNFTQKLVNKLYKNMLRETGLPTFERITIGQIVSDSGYSYGFAWGDYDNDGDLDIATANTFGENQKNALYKNELSNGNKWINIKCIGTFTNKSAIGTKVRVKANINGNPVWQMQEIDGQSGYCGQNLILHFGLGNAGIIDSLVVEWHSKTDQHFTNVALNQSVTITENGSVVSIDEKKTEISNGYGLFQNYPNPFNPETVIRYSINDNRFVTLKVFDILGNEIRTLVNGIQRAGSHEVIFNGKELASGIYYYRLDTEGYSETKKMILAK